MTDEDIDELIASWEQRLGRVDENLIALEGEPAYQMLAGGARASLTGDTRLRVVPALDGLGELFEHRERLNTVLARAKALKAEVSFWNKDDKHAEIVRVLGGPSITLGTRNMPVSQRNLLDPAATEVVIGPAELLGEMVRTYQLARDVVAAVGAAWNRLEPLLASLEQGVAEAQRLAADLGQSDAVRAEVLAVVAELGRVRARVSTDPLGVSGSVDSDLAPRLARLKSDLAELAEHKASVTRGLAEADGLRAKIDEAARKAREAVAHATREIASFDVDAGGESARREVAQGLVPWREKIVGVRDAGRWKPADVGISRWLDAARGVLASEEEVVRRASAALGTRTELEGRLSARRAQASALASRGHAAPPELEQVAREAESTLRGRPTDLVRASAAVEKYEAMLRGLAPKG